MDNSFSEQALLAILANNDGFFKRNIKFFYRKNKGLKKVSSKHDACTFSFLPMGNGEALYRDCDCFVPKSLVQTKTTSHGERFSHRQTSQFCPDLCVFAPLREALPGLSQQS
jgi:hypothetical protein